MHNPYLLGRKRYDNLNIVYIAGRIAYGEDIPADIQARVDAQMTNPDFVKALDKEVTQHNNVREFHAALKAHPKLAGLVRTTVNGQRNWRKLLKYC